VQTAKSKCEEGILKMISFLCSIDGIDVHDITLIFYGYDSITGSLRASKLRPVMLFNQPFSKGSNCYA
jgi:hypothetical protein